MIAINTDIVKSGSIILIIIGAYLSGIIYLAEGGLIPLTLFQIALIIAISTFIYINLSAKNLTIYGYGLEKEYIAYFCLIFISLIYSPEREQGIFYAVRFFVLLGMTYLIYNSIESIKSFKAVIYVIILTALVTAVINIFQFYLNPEIALFNYTNQGTKLIRSAGVEEDPNIFASNFFLPIMFLIAFMGDAKSRKAKLILYGLVSILIASVLITYSRSAWVSIFVGGFIIMTLQRSYSFLIYATITFIGLLLVSESARIVLSGIIERLVDIFAGSSEDSSRIRLMLLHGAMLMWLDSYTFGVGYQGFSTYFQKYYPPQQTIGVYEPHNQFYTVLCELGIIGFIVFMFIIIKLLRIGWSSIFAQKGNKPDSIGLALFASFICYLVFFQFYGGMDYHSFIMINIGLLVTYAKLSEIWKENADLSQTSSA